MTRKALPIPTDNPNPLAPTDLDRLRAAVGPGPVLILTHLNPDPDALSSGAGLAYLLHQAWDLAVDVRYSGLVARAENVAMLHHLTPEWQRIGDRADLSAYGHIILVDTQPGAGNNLAPPDRRPAAVFDHHHPVREQLESIPYLDVRPEIGASATLVYQHLEVAGLTLPARLATALFYGLKTDTRGLSRGAAPDDEVAYLALLAQVDRTTLLTVEHARRPAIFFKGLAEALTAVTVYGGAVIARLDEMHRSDFAAEMADLLIGLEGARGVLCLGWHEGTLLLSIRTVPMGRDAGLLVQQIVNGLGTGGGHGMMAGGQIRLAGRDPAAVETALAIRFLQLMGEEKTAGVRLVD